MVGRSPECDVAVRDLLLSRTHCRIEPAGHGWKVVDLNSRNGTGLGLAGRADACPARWGSSADGPDADRLLYRSV